MFRKIGMILVLIASMTVNVCAADNVPRDEFIKYADGCIDVLDELDVLFSKYSIPKYEATRLIDKYEVCLKKFDRYGDRKDWDKNSLQYQIIEKLMATQIIYTFSMVKAEVGENHLDKIKESNDEIRRDLMKYKENKQKSK